VAAAATAMLLVVLVVRYGCGARRPCEVDRAVISSVGDMMLCDKALPTLEKHGYDYFFQKVGPLFENADLVMGNLEAPITQHDVRLDPDKEWSYHQEPIAADALRESGFDVLCLANNHVLDFGEVGLQDTLDNLQRVGIVPLGAGMDEEAARQGHVVDLSGTRVGLLAYQKSSRGKRKAGWFAEGDHPGCVPMDRDVMREDIARMRERADVVIVHCHYGKNYAQVTEFQEKISREIIDMGADAVNGHHSHAAQGVEIYKGKPILYSLGNFAFGSKGRFERGKQGYGYVARYNLCNGRLESVELDLVGVNNRIVDFITSIIPEDEARQVIGELMEPYGTEVRWEGSTAIIDL